MLSTVKIGTEKLNIERSKKMPSVWRYLVRNKALYAMLLPGIAFFIIFCYIPIFGNVIAFKTFNFAKGIWGSPWAGVDGLDNFRYLFSTEKFMQVFRNTIIISFLKLVWGFPVPLILALLLNELGSNKIKRPVQSFLYIPHFISWPILGGIIIAFFSADRGIVNKIINLFGCESIFFMASNEHFRGLLVGTYIWKEAGWGTIIYLATIAGIDQNLYEAAFADGANRFKRLWHITLSQLRTTIILLLIINTGTILEVGFEQVFTLYNSSVYEVADVLDTYIYRIGLSKGYYSIATAAGLFQSFAGMVMILIGNFCAKKAGEEYIF